MNVLLVGGVRFVGVEIAWHLLHAGHQVTVVAIDSPPSDLRPHVRWLIADRNDARDLARVLGREAFDIVIDNIAYEPDQVRSLIGALGSRIGRYLLTSTTDVYPHNFPRYYTEDQVEIREYDLAALAPGERYRYGKRSCEAVLLHSGVPWTVLRPCQVTGPRDNLNGAPGGRGLAWFETSGRSHFWAQRVMDGGPLLLTSEDESVFSQAWVADVARACTHVIAHPGTTTGQAYNVAGDEIWTNERVVRALAAAAGIAPEIVRVPQAVLERSGLDYAPVYGSAPNWTVLDNAKLKATGWKPTPADQWMPFLLEAQGEPLARTWYHTRLQEIAMARHVQRRHLHAAAWTAAPEPAPGACAIGAVPHRVRGRLEEKASLSWQRQVLGRQAASGPDRAFFRAFNGAIVSSIGIGTAMGDLSRQVDDQYIEALVHGASRGLNVFDTAVNYRHMRSERCVGEAIRRLSRCGIPREALLVSTKGGYITHDAAGARAWDEFVRQEYLEQGLISRDEMARSHSIDPAFIRAQVLQSLDNLGLETVDVYYLHNPEDALAGLRPKEVERRLTASFAVLEEAVADGRIGCYGIATWDALRLPPQAPRHLSLAAAMRCARSAAGSQDHHFRMVQLPFNVRHHEAASSRTQKVGRSTMTALGAAQALGLYAMTSAGALQGASIPAGTQAALQEAAPGHALTTAALHVARSTPGVGTALAGMRRIQSVEEALAIARLEPYAGPAAWPAGA